MDERRPERFRQALNFLVQHGLHIVPRRDRRGRGRPLAQPRLVLPAPRRAAFGVQGGAVGHAVQPVAHQLALADGSRLTSQDQEGGLEGVLGVLLVAEHAPAHPQHHRPVPLHEAGEGAVVPVGGEVVQQLAVGAVPCGRQLP